MPGIGRKVAGNVWVTGNSLYRQREGSADTEALSPAQRPVQVTQDLASFWRTTYFEVKKDLMGRYPKHYWPDNPLAAIPTNRVRPR